MNFLKAVWMAFKVLIGVAAPLAPALAAPLGISAPLALALTGLPTLINEAEEIFGPGTGTVKKTYVVGQALKNVVQGIGTASTGGQKETIEEWKPVIEKAIDDLVTAANEELNRQMEGIKAEAGMG